MKILEIRFEQMIKRALLFELKILRNADQYTSYRMYHVVLGCVPDNDSEDSHPYID